MLPNLTFFKHVSMLFKSAGAVSPNKRKILLKTLEQLVVHSCWTNLWYYSYF